MVGGLGAGEDAEMKVGKGSEIDGIIGYALLVELAQPFVVGL